MGEWRGENAARWRREWNRHTRARWKEMVLLALGGKCQSCSIADPRVLQIDHVQGDGAAETATRGTVPYFKKILVSHAQEEGRYQLLCANCNWIKRYENAEQPRRMD